MTDGVRMESIALIGLPFYTLSRHRGMGMAVRVLRELGLSDSLKGGGRSLTDLGDVTLSEIVQDSGPANLRNFPQFHQDTETVSHDASRISSDDFAFCVGGECTFIVGALAVLRRKFEGKPGILWMDAHGDFNTPETTPSGFIGGMCLAFAAGRGPKLSPEIENLRPLLTEENIVHLGSRALDPLEARAMESSPLRLYPEQQVRREGIERVAKEAAEYLADRADWIICHWDVDVTDPAEIEAVNFPEKGGLALHQIRNVVEALERTGKLRVFDLAAYNPLLDDETKSAGRKVLNLVSEIFS